MAPSVLASRLLAAVRSGATDDRIREKPRVREPFVALCLKYGVSDAEVEWVLKEIEAPVEGAIELGRAKLAEGGSLLALWQAVAGAAGGEVRAVLTAPRAPEVVEEDVEREAIVAEAGASLPVEGVAAEPVAKSATHATDNADGFSRLRLLPTERILEPVPRPPWLCPGMFLGPGRPSMIAAYSYSGKTLAAMALAVAIAAGEKVWGQWSVHEPARVMYLDFEQGGGATRRRFQALLKGMGIEPEALGDRLRLGALPTFRLTDQDAEPYLTAACASLGVDLCVIDTLRAATPGEEENDSRMSAWLEMLTRVSEKTGTTFLVIHHAGKKKQGFGPPDPREAPRGSSAVVGACGTVLVMMKEGDAPSEVTFAKLSADADASPPEPFFLAIEPPNGGVRVVYKSKEQVRPPHDPVRELRGDVERLVGAVAADPGVGARALRATLRGMGSERFKTAREEAIRTGRVVVERKGKSEGHFPKPEASGE